MVPGQTAWCPLGWARTFLLLDLSFLAHGGVCTHPRRSQGWGLRSAGGRATSCMGLSRRLEVAGSHWCSRVRPREIHLSVLRFQEVVTGYHSQDGKCMEGKVVFPSE